MTSTTANPVAEIVTFKLNANVSDDAFLATMAPSHAYASSVPGYVSRQLSKAEDGTWTDYVVWASLQSAKTAAEGFMAQDFAPSVLQSIDKSTFSMRHQTVLWQPSQSDAAH